MNCEDFTPLIPYRNIVDMWAHTIAKATDFNPDHVIHLFSACKIMNVSMEHTAVALRYLKNELRDERASITSFRMFIIMWSERESARHWHKSRTNRIKYKLFKRWKRYPYPDTDFTPTVRLSASIIQTLKYILGIDEEPPRHINCRCTFIPMEEE